MCLQGRQAGAGLASNGDQMGHGPWGQGWAPYRTGFNRKGELEGPGGRKPSLTPTQQGVGVYCRIIRATAPPMATHAAASLGLNSVVRTHVVTSVLV